MSRNPLRKRFRAAALAACATLSMAGAVMAQSTTAELFGMQGALIANGQYDLVTPPNPEELFAPIHDMRASLVDGLGSTTLIGQIGTTNFATSGIEGPGNLSVIAQAGTNNRAVHAIAGSNSALLLVQSGESNNVIQASIGDKNAQIVGVGGTGNDVAYVQMGNELSGALNVAGRNSAVIALQTQGSGSYLMPTGLRGLDNQVVVIVPGRMYVFNRNAL